LVEVGERGSEALCGLQEIAEDSGIDVDLGCAAG
jgi:hypothetical protein